MRRWVGITVIVGVGIILVSGAWAIWRQGGIGPARLPAGDLAPAAEPITEEGPVSILLLGTSLTRRGDWPSRLAARLSACVQREVSVRRIARPGAASDWGTRRLREALSAAGGAQPDILVIEFTINDAALHRGRALTRSKADHLLMIDAAQAAGVSVFLATMSPAAGPRGWVRPGHGAYIDLYRALARARGLGLIDTISAWDALPPGIRRTWLPDGLHPTDEAMRAIAVPAFAASLGRALGAETCG
ncbi:MAG: SGNH/GDSL hydrolase family protein [Pikeienuella sp.]